MKEGKKLALVTGASSGIGLELARILAQEGYDLVVASGSDKIEAAAKELRTAGGKVIPILADLATQEGVDTLIQALPRTLDVAALNAGVGVGGKFLDNDFQEELNLMNLNMVYLVALMKNVLKGMAYQKTGKVLVTSSIAGEMPGPYYAVYAASKAFVQSFTEAVRFELKEAGLEGITVTALQPGATATDFFRRAHMLDTKAGKGKKDDAAQVARDGYEALMAGKDHVVAGSFMNTVQSTAAKFMTDQQGASAHASSTRPQ